MQPLEYPSMMIYPDQNNPELQKLHSLRQNSFYYSQSQQSVTLPNQQEIIDQSVQTQKKKQQQQQLPPLNHVLVIDGAYLQIGMNQANQQNNQFFPLDKPGNFDIYITFLEKMVGHEFNQIKFVTAEDNETNARHKKFYDELARCKKVQVDQREFKYRSQTCKCKNEVKWKVQAEVDVAIAVYLIDYAQSNRVDTITLFAGDRDFIDAIMYCRDRLKKQLLVLAYEENLASRIKQSGVSFINVSDYLYMLKKFQKRQEKKNLEALKAQQEKEILQMYNKKELMNQQTSKKQVTDKSVSSTSTFVGEVVVNPETDPVIKRILFKQQQANEDSAIEKGQFFTDQSFNKQCLTLLQEHSSVNRFEAEHAMFTTNTISLQNNFAFIFNTHQLLKTQG
eukprot:403368196